MENEKMIDRVINDVRTLRGINHPSPKKSQRSHGLRRT